MTPPTSATAESMVAPAWAGAVTSKVSATFSPAWARPNDCTVGETVQPAEGIAEVLIDQCGGSFVAICFKYRQSSRVVVAGLLVLIESLMKVGDVGAEFRVTLHVATFFQPVLCGLRRLEGILITAGQHQCIDISDADAACSEEMFAAVFVCR